MRYDGHGVSDADLIMLVKADDGHLCVCQHNRIINLSLPDV